MNNLGTFDYVVVGGGTAGCVLANRLSQDPDASVLLLEAGGKDNWLWIHIPVGYLYCIGNPRTDWCFHTEAESGLNGRSILYARGRVLGGCSSINAMVYMRGQARDYESWARTTGDPSWSWEHVLPVFKRSEDYWRGGDDVHGAGGEMRVEPQRLHWDILDRFADAAEQAGIPRTADFNRGNNFGVGRFEVTQRRGIRWNARKAFLRPVIKRPNLKVVTGALIDRVTFDGKRATGVELLLDGQRTRAAARIETVLAAGSIGSPNILERSGVGDGARLQALGINTVAHLPGIGGNLQDHLQLRMIFKIQGIKCLNTMMTPWGRFLIGLEYALFQSGPLAMAPSQLGAFAKSDEGQEAPDVEYHVQPLSLDKFGDPLHKFPAFTASVCDLQPTSRGYVHIASGDPAAAPKIAPCYLSTDTDRRSAAAALRLTRRIVSMPALAPHRPEEYLPGPSFETDEQLATAAGDIGTTIFHPVGTCKMGRADDDTAVVDSRLRVRGVEGLRVVDASVMPTITHGNTNAPTVMIAERGSDFIRQERKSR